MTAAVFEERVDPGRFASGFLAFLVHVLLIAVLVLGVRWQNKMPETVSVELWEPPQAVVQPAQPVEPPKPEPRVETPPPPKPEPRIEKPDIVEKAPPKPEPKVEKKPAPKPEPKPVPLKPRVDESQKRMQEALAREQASLAVDQERQRMREQLARDSAAVKSKSLGEWTDKVRAKVKGNVFLPTDIQGNPEAIFEVTQLPTGEVLSVRLKKSSGNAALDQAIERAILKSSPLPKPDRETPPRTFDLKYRPRDAV